MWLLTNRTEASQSTALTPPVWRLRAAVIWRLPAPATAGMRGSPVRSNQPDSITSGAEVLGVNEVWNRNSPSSLWMSPRQSSSRGVHALRHSDSSSVLEVPSVMSANLVLRGLLRLPLI